MPLTTNHYPPHHRAVSFDPGTERHYLSRDYIRIMSD